MQGIDGGQPEYMAVGADTQPHEKPYFGAGANRTNGHFYFLDRCFAVSFIARVAPALKLEPTLESRAIRLVDGDEPSLGASLYSFATHGSEFARDDVILSACLRVFRGNCIGYPLLR